MAEYIEKDVAIAKLTNLEATLPLATMTDAKRVLADIPAADVAPVVHGRFVVDERTYPGPGLRNYKCSMCGRINGTWLRDLKPEQFPNYCWNCGAKMEDDRHD